MTGQGGLVSLRHLPHIPSLEIILWVNLVFLLQRAVSAGRRWEIEPSFSSQQASIRLLLAVPSLLFPVASQNSFTPF